MKLLLVEDDPEICGMLKKFLEKENFEIITANDGEEACSKFRQETCDLVLLDLMLPKISGMDVLQQIRAQSTVPIIIMSAKDTDSDITLGLGLGADDYVTKPFSMVQVLARIKANQRRTGQYAASSPARPSLL
ncbi:response regulator transcription factor, partial [Eisenbergiella porci]|uniref:response regulator transcription factor n=1 Tax=Eisenbergiella porci TaxID=2652274 RepID=UPI002A82410B